MTKQLTILLLILSILSYSTVWAMHSHDDVGTQEQSFSHSDSVSSEDAESRHHLDDDHCCHASVHLLGLLNSNIDVQPVVVATTEAYYSFYLFSYHNSPPQRPPLV
ncbi:MAG TPA: hypothetical protein EYG50_03735 [Cycloclasticus sp.]|nr:hypothetical protein [Cycloclasticus sp.]HIL91848.1 hypothetical protein [Cycloclasticus sp.]